MAKWSQETWLRKKGPPKARKKKRMAVLSTEEWSQDAHVLIPAT